MTGEATSPRLARWAPSEWRGFAAFLRRPVLPERMTGIRFAAIGRVLQLFALDLVLMGLILGLIQLATAIGFHIPSNEIDKLKLTPLLLLLVIVLLPMGEEMVFRSWLSGRAGPMIALVVVAVGVAIPVISGPQAHPILLLGSLAIAALLAIGVAVWLRKRRAMPFFARHFVWFYFASALLFAAAHLMNYSDGITLALLPLVVPQLIAGLIFGYARVTFGLWSDMMLHMMHNGLLVGLIVLSKGM
jgi:membrane protease YdiL (CAAX protease family)